MNPPRHSNIRLLGSQAFADAVRVLSHAPLDGSLEFVLQPWRNRRTQDQNARYWSILRIEADHTGETPDAIHKRHKRDVVIPILFRDSQVWKAKREAVQRFRDNQDHDMADRLARALFSEVSTTDLTTAQFGELMESAEAECAELGLALPPREDDQ